MKNGWCVDRGLFYIPIKNLIDRAEKTIEIAAFYWNLNETYPTSKPGKDVFNALQNAGRRGVKVVIFYQKINVTLDSHSSRYI